MKDGETSVAYEQEKDVSETTIRAQTDINDEKKAEVESTVSTKIKNLRSNKQLAKVRMTKAKKHLSDLIESRPADVPLPSKNTVRRAVNRVNSEVNIITSIIGRLRELYAMGNDNEETSTVIDTLDKEFDDI